MKESLSFENYIPKLYSVMPSWLNSYVEDCDSVLQIGGMKVVEPKKGRIDLSCVHSVPAA